MLLAVRASSGAIEGAPFQARQSVTALGWLRAANSDCLARSFNVLVPYGYQCPFGTSKLNVEFDIERDLRKPHANPPQFYVLAPESAGCPASRNRNLIAPIS